MHGCHRFAAGLLLCLSILFSGCESSPPAAEDDRGAAPLAGSEFNAARTGSISGRVVWEGAARETPPFQERVHLFHPGGGEKITRENPIAPRIDPASGGVGDVVVYLRGVDPKRARPWDHAPVRVEQRDYRLHVHQSEVDSRVGFVRRGDEVEMLSTQPVMHSLRAAGAAFFTLAFPDPNQPRSRRLERNGLVELSSAADYYWMRAYLFVAEHPYFTRTDAQGRFTLTDVPPGDYQVICWMPNWRKARHTRNPDTGMVTRWYFQSPRETAQSLTLHTGESPALRFTISEAMFEQ